MTENINKQEIMYFLEGENNKILTWPVILKEFQEGLFLIINYEVLAEDYKRNNTFTKAKAQPFEFKGLALKFARLKKESDFLNFANKYGLLGLKPLIDTNHSKQFEISSFGFNTSQPQMEHVNIWKWHIKHIGKLIKLYNALKNNTDIEDLIYMEPQPSSENYTVYWDDGTIALKNIESDFTQLKKIASLILHNDTVFMLKQGVKIKWISAHNITGTNDPAIYLKFTEKKYTPYVITAIYYDLWRMINDAETLKFCPMCMRPFSPKRADAIFCSGACRTRKSRLH